MLCSVYREPFLCFNVYSINFQSILFRLHLQAFSEIYLFKFATNSREFNLKRASAKWTGSWPHSCSYANRLNHMEIVLAIII